MQEDIKIIKDADDALEVLRREEEQLRTELRERDRFDTPQATRDFAVRLQRVMCAIIAISDVRDAALKRLADIGCPPPTLTQSAAQGWTNR